MSEEKRRGPHPEWPMQAQRDWYARECSILRNKLRSAEELRDRAVRESSESGKLAWEAQCAMDDMRKGVKP
jgi:hypothetical protein